MVSGEDFPTKPIHWYYTNLFNYIYIYIHMHLLTYMIYIYIYIHIHTHRDIYIYINPYILPESAQGHQPFQAVPGAPPAGARLRYRAQRRPGRGVRCHRALRGGRAEPGGAVAQGTHGRWRIGWCLQKWRFWWGNMIPSSTKCLEWVSPWG